MVYNNPYVPKNVVLTQSLKRLYIWRIIRRHIRVLLLNPPSLARGRCGRWRQYQLFVIHGLETYLSKRPLLTSAKDITHGECGRTPVMWYNFVCVFGITLIVSRAVFRMWMGHSLYMSIGIPTHLQIGACICGGATADTVAIGEVNCYNTVTVRYCTNNKSAPIIIKFFIVVLLLCDMCLYTSYCVYVYLYC